MRRYIRVRFARAIADLTDFYRRNITSGIFGLIASVIVLPLVPILAGASMTEEALLLVAYGVLGPIALTVLAFVWFYWRAPAKIYADQLAENNSLRERISRLEDCPAADEDPLMSFQDLVQFAEQECGWVIREGKSYEIFDLRDWISDAAGIGRVVIYGRYNPENMSNSASISLTEIPVSHWKDHELYSFDAFYIGGDVTPFSLERLNRSRRKIYVDLHVNRHQAKKYFRLDAEKWRGRNREKYEQQQKRREEFEAEFNQSAEAHAPQQPPDTEERKQP